MSQSLELEMPAVKHSTVLDDESRHVARVYAEALYRAAEKQNKVQEVLDEIQTLVNEVFAKDPGLELFFASAAVGRERKANAIDVALKPRVSGVFSQFLGVLNEHDRLDRLRSIAGAFRTLYDRRTRNLVVQVRSAVPLTDSERDRLRNDLREVSGFEPVLQETVDPEILGGLIVRVEDWIYDASVRTRIVAIKDQLTERRSHGIQSGRDRFRT